MPEWFDKAKEKTVSGYQSVRDSKATKIAGRTVLGAGGGVVNTVKNTRSLSDVANIQTRIVVGAAKGGLDANGVDTSGVDKVLNATSTDPRGKLELATHAARKIEEYRKEQDSDRDAFPNAGNAGKDLEKREKGDETQFRLTNHNSIYRAASDIKESKKQHTIHDYKTAYDKERDEVDDPVVTEHRRYLAKKADSNYGIKRTNEHYISYQAFDPLTDVLSTEVWLILAEAKFNPGKWITPSAVLKKHYPNHKPSQTLSVSGKNQLLAMCSLDIGAGQDIKVKFYSTVVSFVAHLGDSTRVKPDPDMRWIEMQDGSLRYSWSYEPHTHWTSPTRLPSESLGQLPSRCNFTYVRTTGSGEDVWAYRWYALNDKNVREGRDTGLYLLDELHLHGKNGGNWMWTTEQLDQYGKQ